MNRSLVKNSADPKQVRNATDKEQLRADQEINDLRSLMETAHGRRYLRRLIVEVAGRDRSTYVNGPTGRGSDQVFLEGMRNIGLMEYARVLEHCPELWLQAEKEYHAQLQMDGLT